VLALVLVVVVVVVVHGKSAGWIIPMVVPVVVGSVSKVRDQVVPLVWIILEPLTRPLTQLMRLRK
jgi:hypothetical protein